MADEIFARDGELVSEAEWRSRIDGLRSSVPEKPLPEDKAVEMLCSAIERAVVSRIPKGGKVGLLLSGGVDSSLIALLLKKAGADFKCYTMGFKDQDTKEPEDVESARKLAEELGLDLKVRMLGLSDAEGLFKKTVKILGPPLTNVVSVGVAAVEIGTLELAAADNIRVFFGGLGSEEVFAGYERHKKASDSGDYAINDECWAGLLGMYERDLLRDSAVASAMKVSFATPFLDTGLMRIAMQVPGGLKLRDGHSKFIIRKAAEKLGLSREIAWRRKRAAQYGSRVDGALGKLARRRGFSLKKDYLGSLRS